VSVSLSAVFDIFKADDPAILSVNGQNMCVNNYDVRLTDTHPACGMNWPPDLTELHPYLSVSEPSFS